MTLAIVAGICAACAGFFAKLPSFSDKQQILPPWLWIAACVLLVLALNAVMWTFYTKALQERGGTLVATVVSSGTNYCFSALLGCLVFGERTTLIWWLGMSMVVLGLFIVNYNETKQKRE